MYDVGGKLLSGIKSMYVDSSAYVRVKGCESELFRIDSGVSQGCIMFPWMFSIYIYIYIYIYIHGWSDEGGEDGDGMERSELPEGWERVEIACPLVCR